MTTDNKDKRVLRVELEDEVKKVSVTGVNSEEKVVMHQELEEADLEQVTGGGGRIVNGCYGYNGGECGYVFDV